MSNTKGTLLMVGGAIALGISAVLLIKHFSKPGAGGQGTGPALPPPLNDYAGPGNDFIPGKTVYASAPNTKTWIRPIVNEGGWFGIGSTKQYDIPQGSIAGWIVAGPMKGEDMADPNQWYKIRVYTVKPQPAVEYGYVRSDVITIK